MEMKKKLVKTLALALALSMIVDAYGAAAARKTTMTTAVPQSLFTRTRQ